MALGWVRGKGKYILAETMEGNGELCVCQDTKNKLKEENT